MKLKAKSEAFNNFVKAVDDVLSKVHSTDYRGNTPQPGDVNFDDARRRLQSIALVCDNETELRLLDSEYVCNMLIFNELTSREEERDRQEAVATRRAN